MKNMINKNPIKRDMKLSIENEKIEDPGEPSFQEPNEKNGKDKIFSGSLSRGYIGSKEHPRG